MMTYDFSQEAERLCGALLAFVLARCGVAVDDEELEFGEGGHFPVGDLLEHLAVGHRVVEKLLLGGGRADQG